MCGQPDTCTAKALYTPCVWCRYLRKHSLLVCVWELFTQHQCRSVLNPRLACECGYHGWWPGVAGPSYSIVSHGQIEFPGHGFALCPVIHYSGVVPNCSLECWTQVFWDITLGCILAVVVVWFCVRFQLRFDLLANMQVLQAPLLSAQSWFGLGAPPWPAWLQWLWSVLLKVDVEFHNWIYPARVFRVNWNFIFGRDTIWAVRQYINCYGLRNLLEDCIYIVHTILLRRIIPQPFLLMEYSVLRTY